jgi:hypothetical protein
MDPDVELAFKKLESGLAFKLNKLLHHHFKLLFTSLGFSDQIEHVRAEKPGNKVAELIFRMIKRNGAEGLHEFIKLLEELKEKENLKLINDNPVVSAVVNKFLNGPSSRISATAISPHCYESTQNQESFLSLILPECVPSIKFLKIY